MCDRQSVIALAPNVYRFVITLIFRNCNYCKMENSKNKTFLHVRNDAHFSLARFPQIFRMFLCLHSSRHNDPEVTKCFPIL